MSLLEEQSSSDLIERLRERLRAPLPGRSAQRRFEPEWAFGRHFDRPSSRARRAAVLLLVYPRDGVWHLPLTVRPRHLASHGGQISLPGGVIEPGETAHAAALRELHEELGVTAESLSILGPLTPLFIFGSGYFVEPWLAATTRELRFLPNVDEVAEVVEAPVAALCDPSAWGRHRLRTRGIVHEAPHLLCGAHRVWGATAMILGEFAALYDDVAACAPFAPATPVLSREAS